MAGAFFFSSRVRTCVFWGCGNSENLTAAQRKTNARPTQDQRKTNHRPTPNQRKPNNGKGAFLSPTLIDFETMPKIAPNSHDNILIGEIIKNKAIARNNTKRTSENGIISMHRGYCLHKLTLLALKYR